MENLLALGELLAVLVAAFWILRIIVWPELRKLTHSRTHNGSANDTPPPVPQDS